MTCLTWSILAFTLFLLINVITYRAFERDKDLARNQQWRTKESTLIGLSFLGGAFGGYLAMKQHHHKTNKLKFRLLLPLAMILWLALFGLVLYSKVS